jgi:hypothetical protein
MASRLAPTSSEGASHSLHRDAFDRFMPELEWFLLQSGVASDERGAVDA